MYYMAEEAISMPHFIICPQAPSHIFNWLLFKDLKGIYPGTRIARSVNKLNFRFLDERRVTLLVTPSG
jgi:hypothetical protein